jgi:uncharacterized delta-60 repeat protein
MRTLRTKFTLAIPLLITAMLITFNFSRGVRAFPQDIGIEAAPGDLDTTFGNAGKVTTAFPGFQASFANAMAIQADGKIVVAGEAESDTADDFATARYNPDGSLDSSFGTAGRVTTDFFGFRDFASGVAIQTDGKILVGGSCKKSQSDDSYDFALVRYNSNGSLDGSFGSGGKVTLDLGGNAEELLNTILVQSDGRIIVAARTLLGCCTVGFHVGLARFNQNGSLDLSFGSGGKVVSPLVTPYAAALAAGDRIVVAGEVGISGSPAAGDFGMARFNSDGSLDTQFGNTGVVSTDFFGHTDAALAVTFQADGKIVLGGLVRTADDAAHQDFGLARYSSEGVLDNTFGTGGKVTTDFGGTEDRVFSLTQYTGGRLVAGGSTEGQTPSTRDFAVAQYQPDGTLDPTFGAGGKVVTGFSNQSVDAMSAIAVTPDARAFIAAGSTNNSFAVARYVALGEPPSFSLALDPISAAGDRGTTVKVHLLINRTAGFTGNVTVTPPDASEIGIKVKPGSEFPTIDQSITYKLKIKDGATTGSHQLTFTGRDDSGRRTSATLTITIQ